MHQKSNFFNLSPFSLPHTFRFDNEEYEVRDNFKDWIKLSLLYDDKTLSDEDKIQVALNLVFKDKDKVVKDLEERKLNIVEVFEAINLFFNCGEIKEKKEEDKERLFDFKQDWDYIYSAFMQQYKIDLNEEKMHWFKFIGLFKGLSSETEFLKIIGYRGTDINKLPKEQKKFYRKMKEKYALKDEYAINDEACLFDGDADEMIRKMSRG